MTDERDLELGRRLAEIDTPDHRPGFWSDLRVDLANSTNLGSDAGEDLVEDEGASTSTSRPAAAGADLVESGAVVELAERRQRRRWPNGVLVAAAGAVVALISAGIVLSTGTDDDADVATDPTLTTDPTPPDDQTTSTATTEPAGPLRPDGEPVERGVGRPLAVDPTGTFLYVAAPAPEGGFGCEGAPAEALYVERVDGDGSDRTLAIDPGVVDATGLPLIALSDTGEVALVPRCEGHGSRVVTGTIADDGTVADRTELTISDLDLGREADGITDLGFSEPGVLVATTYSVADDGTDHRHLYSFPTSAGEVSDLGQEGAIAVEVSDDGRIVTLTADGRLLVDGQVRGEGGEPGRQLAVGGGTIALTSANGTEVHELEPAGAADGRSFPIGGWDPHVVPPTTLVFVRIEDEGASVVALDPASGETTTLVAGGAGGLAIASGADVLFVAGATEDPAAPPPLLEQRLSR